MCHIYLVMGYIMKYCCFNLFLSSSFNFLASSLQPGTRMTCQGPLQEFHVQDLHLQLGKSYRFRDLKYWLYFIAHLMTYV